MTPGRNNSSLMAGQSPTCFQKTLKTKAQISFSVGSKVEGQGSNLTPVFSGFWASGI